MPAQLDDPIALLTGRGKQPLRPVALAPAVGISPTSSSAQATSKQFV